MADAVGCTLTVRQIFVGELGLTGEVRSVTHPDRRLGEAAKFGLTPLLAPTGAGRGAAEVATLADALQRALPAAGDGRLHAA